MVASYPYDDSASHKAEGAYSKSPDDSLFKYLALVYAENNPVMKTGQPKCEENMAETFQDGITNGAKWYDVSGMLPTFVSSPTFVLHFCFVLQASCQV